MSAAALLLLLAWPAAAQAKPEPGKLSTQDKIRSSLVLCLQVGAEPEGRNICAKALGTARDLAKLKDLAEPEKTTEQVGSFIASLDASSGTKTAAQLEAEFEAIAKALPVRQFKPRYAKYFPPPAPPPDAGAAPAAAAERKEAQGKLTPAKEKDIRDRSEGIAQALLPTKKEESLPASPAKAEEPWRTDARDMYKVWTCRQPKTADLSLCEFAARELRAHNIPWRVALANWDFATSLKTSHRYSAGGMTAEGLTDASWTWCRGHREVVRGLLGRPGKRADLYNPRASILWWIAEYEEHRGIMGKDTDPWKIAGGVFLPAAPNSKRVQREIRGWKSVYKLHDYCLLPPKKKP